ncbi:hypothetical protein FS749_005568, partial [Ceratobasidium sp. UAMH 11750]
AAWAYSATTPASAHALPHDVHGLWPDELGTTDDVIRAPALRVALADPASRLFITGSQRTRVLSNPVCFVTEYNWDIALHQNRT